MCVDERKNMSAMLGQDSTVHRTQQSTAHRKAHSTAHSTVHSTDIVQTQTGKHNARTVHSTDIRTYTNRETHRGTEVYTWSHTGSTGIGAGGLRLLPQWGDTGAMQRGAMHSIPL